ncbi:low molecular weight protein-tyrosine-phosphatase [Arhodomonas sp. SL1]|uniref:low molecular weight protein-tyrosine-phosphatase n=1 Tax=Arhodomonas sp. SL1 TaxID=3425691 RepID=UPI003F8812C5
MIRVLMVCMGNICRSPSAEGVFRALLEEAGLETLVDVDSAGTHGFHVGRPPDPRAREAAARRGIDIGGLRARQVDAYDFEAFDYIIAMDDANYGILIADAPSAARERVHRLLDFAPGRGESEVPDPYYGGHDGFEYVLDLVEEAARGLLSELRERHRL